MKKIRFSIATFLRSAVSNEFGLLSLIEKVHFIPVLMILLLVSCAKSIQTVDDNVPKSWTENWIVASKTVVVECEFTNGKRFWIKRNGTRFGKGLEHM